jgi:Primase C terminal 2 (PriCT-2)/RepB DNA-primase from phage plasmid
MIGPLDYSYANRFVRMLDRNAQHFTLQTFDDDRTRKDGALTRVLPSAGIADPELRQLHALGAGVYITINQTDLKWRSNDNVTRIRAVWQEDDDGFTGTFPIEPTLVVESSPGKYHRYWLVSDDWPADEQGRRDFTGVMARMVQDYGGDKQAVDLARVLRLPGYLHRKRKNVDAAVQAHEVRIAKVHPQLRRYRRAEILEAFPPIQEVKSRPIAAEFAPVDADGARIRNALFSINSDDREIWLRMGMAIKHELGEGGRTLWDEWSATSDKFDARDQEKTWHSFRRNGVSAGTIFHEAARAGWHDPGAERYERVCEELKSKAAAEDSQAGARAAGDEEFTADELSRMEFAPIKCVWLHCGGANALRRQAQDRQVVASDPRRLERCLR